MRRIDYKRLLGLVFLTLVMNISVICNGLPIEIKSEARPPVVVLAQVDKAKATTSDTISFTITLDAANKIKVELPQLGAQIEGFRITDFETVGPKAEDDRVISKRIYKLQADLAGTYILPRISIEYEDASKKIQTVKTSEIFVEIESRLKKDSDGKEPQDIRDIKGLATLPFKLGPWEIILIITILVVFGVVALIWYRTSRPGKKLETPPVPPHILALKRIKELEEMAQSEADWEQAITGGAIEKRFHFALSEIARQYFEWIFKIPTTDMTTEEIRQKVTPFTGISDQLKKSFLNLLNLTDLVKFTDSRLGLTQSIKLLDDAKNIISKTRPADVNLEDNADKDKNSKNSEDSFI